MNTSYSSKTHGSTTFYGMDEPPPSDLNSIARRQSCMPGAEHNMRMETPAVGTHPTKDQGPWSTDVAMTCST